MLRTARIALAAAATAAALAPAAAHAATGTTSPSPTQPQTYAYTTTFEQAEAWRETGNVDVRVRMTKRTPSMLRSVAAAGEPVSLWLYIDGWGWSSQGAACGGVTDADGRFGCVLSSGSFFSNGSATGMHVVAKRYVDGAWQENASTPVTISSHE